MVKRALLTFTLVWLALQGFCQGKRCNNDWCFDKFLNKVVKQGELEIYDKIVIRNANETVFQNDLWQKHFDRRCEAQKCASEQSSNLAPKTLILFSDDVALEFHGDSLALILTRNNQLHYWSFRNIGLGLDDLTKCRVDEEIIYSDKFAFLRIKGGLYLLEVDSVMYYLRKKGGNRDFGEVLEQLVLATKSTEFSRKPVLLAGAPCRCSWQSIIRSSTYLKVIKESWILR